MKGLKWIVPILGAVLALRCISFAPTGGAFVENLAVLSAGFVMPEGVAVVYTDILRHKEPEKTETEESEPPHEVLTEKKEEPSTEKQAEPPASPAQPPAGTEKGGDVKEQQYGATEDTVKYKNILFQNRTANHKVDLEKILEEKPDLSLNSDGKPSVLIFHTHTTEAYQDYDVGWYPKNFKERSLNSEKNMIRVGDEICKELEAAGIGVIHDKNVYDNPAYTGAYERSGEKVDEYLEKYPSIQIVLDIHRDSIEYKDGTKSKPTAVIDGKKTAQMMIISGCQEGDMTGFDDWEYNLRFALRLHRQLETDYPGVMRPLFFAPRKYNMYKTHNSLLIEMGSDVNTLDEAVRAGGLLGKSLAKLCADYM